MAFLPAATDFFRADPLRLTRCASIGAVFALALAVGPTVPPKRRCMSALAAPMALPVQ